MDITAYLNSFSKGLAEYWYELKAFLYLIFVSLSIDIDTAKTLSLLMIIDTVLGVSKTLRIKKITFDFKELLWGIVSKCTVILIPILLAVTALGLGFDFTLLVNVVFKILIVNETISALTNILSIKKRKNIKNTDYVSLLIYKLKNFLKNIINKLLKTYD